MNPPNELVAVAVPLMAGWIWWVDRKVSAHEEVIKAINQLVHVLLEDRLSAQNKERRHS